jgi:hypothetical protein
MDDNASGGDEWYAFDNVKFAKSTPAANILTFDFGAPYGLATISGTDISITVPYGTTPLTFSPTYTLTYGATCVPLSPPTTPLDFSSPSGVDYVVSSAAPVITKTYNVKVHVAPALVFGEEQYQADGADPSPIGVLSGDLLETSVASVTGEPASIDGGSPLPHLRNGIFGDYVMYNDSSEYTTTYALDITSNPAGYDIKEIRLFSNGGSRTSQAYDLKYSLVGAPDTFLPLGTYTGTLPPSANGTLMTRTYDIRAATPDAGPPILTGVAAIQFVIRPNGNGALYREWDVTGSATAVSTTPTVTLTIANNGDGNVTIGGTVTHPTPGLTLHLWKSNDLKVWSDTGVTVDASSGSFTFFPPQVMATDGTQTFYMVK